MAASSLACVAVSVSAIDDFTSLYVKLFSSRFCCNCCIIAIAGCNCGMTWSCVSPFGKIFRNEWYSTGGVPSGALSSRTKLSPIVMPTESTALHFMRFSTVM